MSRDASLVQEHPELHEIFSLQQFEQEAHPAGHIGIAAVIRRGSAPWIIYCLPVSADLPDPEMHDNHAGNRHEQDHM
jgi:hypothetical protein